MVNHILYHGAALCGQPGLPKDWPEGEKWVYADDLAHVTCPSCKVAIGLLEEGATAGGAELDLSDSHLSDHNAGIMVVTKVELEAIGRERRPDDPKNGLIEVELRARAVRTSDMRTTPITFVRRVMLYLRAHRGRLTRFDLNFSDDGRDARMVFELPHEHVAKLFEVVKL